jgi:hypothetical protein
MLLSGLAIVALGTLVWRVLSPREPEYRGKTVQVYFDQLARAFVNNRTGRVYEEVKADDPMVKAIYACGPDAIPYLRRALRKKDGRAEKIISLLRAKLPASISKRFPPSKSDYVAGSRDAAIRSLATFGPTARRSQT